MLKANTAPNSISRANSRFSGPYSFATGNSGNLANKCGASGSRMRKNLKLTSAVPRECIHSEDLPANGGRVHSKITNDRLDVIA